MSKHASFCHFFTRTDPMMANSSRFRRRQRKFYDKKVANGACVAYLHTDIHSSQSMVVLWLRHFFTDFCRDFSFFQVSNSYWEMRRNTAFLGATAFFSAVWRNKTIQKSHGFYSKNSEESNIKEQIGHGKGPARTNIKGIDSWDKVKCVLGLSNGAPCFIGQSDTADCSTALTTTKTSAEGPGPTNKHTTAVRAASTITYFAHVQRRAVRQQQPHHVGLAPAAREMQRRVPLRVPRPHRSPADDELVGGLHLAIPVYGYGCFFCGSNRLRGRSIVSGCVKEAHHVTP